MKLFIKNCFLALLCLYRSHQKNTPFRGQGATPPTLQEIKAIAYIGSRYPCLLAKLLKLSHLMIKIKQISRPPFPPSHTFQSKVKSQLSSLASRFSLLGSCFLSSRFSGQDFVSWFSNLKSQISNLISRFSLLASRLSPLVSCFLILASCFSNLKSPISYLPSRLSHLASLFILLTSSFILPPKVAFTQSTGVLSNTPAPVVIYGEIMALSGFDTLNLVIHEDYLGKLVRLPEPKKHQLPAMSGDGYYGLPGQIAFSFTTSPISAYAYASLSSKAHGNIFSEFLVSPGDTVGLFLDRLKNRLVFTGPSALKFKIQQELDNAFVEETAIAPAYFPVNDMEEFIQNSENSKALDYGIRSFIPYQKEQSLELYNDKLKKDISRHPGFEVLEKYKGKVDDDFFELLKINFIGKLLFSKVFSFNVKSKADREAWSQTYLDGSRDLPEIPQDPSLVLFAPYYTDYLLEKYVADGYAERKRALDAVLAIEDEKLRDRLLAKFMIRYYRAISNKEEYVDRVLEVMKDSTSLTILNGFLAGRLKGTEVPDFSLTDLDNNPVSLREFRGKVVFMDFWFTGCHACVLFNKNIMTPVEAHFEGNDEVVFLAISIDSDPAKWAKSVASGKYVTPHANNLFTGGMGTDHPLIRFFGIQGFPSQVLLDREGKIVETTGLSKSPESVQKIISDTINQTP